MSETTFCPKCGTHLAMNGSRLGITLEGNILEKDGSLVELPRIQARLLEALLERWPYTLSKNAIIERLWDVNDEPETADKVLESHISKLRISLKPFGLMIKNFRYEGYRLKRIDVAN